ncbi:lamin tail domain-containing protein, partial [Candidatus Poribacteria bacterium]|nr:lamin tail domain-containing protein [Candidatus Poribacteria bacterium]
MSNRLTFSLASLILIFAFAAMPAMAEPTVSATWTTDVNGDGTADDEGWNATLTYTTAPAAGALPATTDVGATVSAYDPAGGDGTATSFTFDIEPDVDGTDVTVTFAGFRRVTLRNALDLAATSIAQPKLKSITAPEATNKFFNAVITFETPAAAMTGTPAVPEIGPSDSLIQSDLTVTNGGILSFTDNSDGTYTVAINPTDTPVTVVITAAGFPFQAPDQAADATASVIYDTAAPARDAATNAATDGPDTIPVNNRKPAPPDSGQWGPGNFDFIFTITDALSGVRASSISLEDNQSPHILSFSNIGRTLLANQFAATVSTANVDIEAGTIVTILATVSDKAGNEATFPVGNVTLAAKSMTAVDMTAAFTSATPATGGSVMQGGTIALVFGTDPGVVTASVGTITGTGTMRTLTIPATQTAGAVSIMLSWGTSGTQTLAYTVTEMDAPAADVMVTIPAKSYVIVARTMSPMGLPMSAIPANPDEMSSPTTIMAWPTMPNLEDYLFRGATLLLTTPKATMLDRDGDGGTTAAEAAKKRDALITEVMAAVNTAEVGQMGYTAHQWIELYNKLPVPITATLSATQGRPAPDAGSTEVRLDRLSNQVGAGWAFDLGQNGFDDDAQFTGVDETGRANVDFVSFFRNDRGGQNDRDGHNKNRWSTSTDYYLGGHKGTPGAIERKTATVLGTTSFNVGPVIFNEVSNRSSGTYEWFELRNKSDSEQNLKNREIRIVKDVGTDTSLFQFGDQDLKIPAGGVLLCVFTDPRDDDDHPVATGWNVDLGDNDQINGVNKETSARYLIIADSRNGKRKFNDDALRTEGFPEEFVLILRSRRHNDDVGKDTNIWDIAGYDTSLKVAAEDAGFTNLWPLKGGVRDAQLSNNKWVVGEVHRRQKDNVWGTSSTNYGRNSGNHHDDTAWRNVGWTGIGYRRNAAAGNENGGTPGYANNTLQSNETQAGADPVIISEIMYATGTRANIPQWIELYNTSKTVGINLDGWRVTIINHDQDLGGETYAGDLNKDYAINGKIPPGQTFLLVAYAGRNDTNLPSERVHALRGNKRGELILSQYGFEITLLTKGKDNKDANRKLADKVGNLATVVAGEGRVRRNPQSYEDPVWMLPMGTNDDGDRVSIVRASMKGDPINGQLPGAWNTFDMSAQFVSTLETTSYGHNSDLSSPGHTVGGVLPVSLSKFRPERMKDTGAVVIRWITESELNNAGFNIL